MKKAFFSSIFLLFIVYGQYAFAEKKLLTLDELTDLNLRELTQLKIVVTSAAKKPQPLADTAHAVFVITQEDLRRSGATSIAHALRMVPGVQVSRIDLVDWAISARGFNEFFANKLLVLIDGRSVYSPQFSGVYWDVQDTLLEDIERIEVIRGPGATIWGANAVNGVINIITKSARNTQGGWVAGAAGYPQERGAVSVRYGDKMLNEEAYYRIFIKSLFRDEPDPLGVFDDWQSQRGGFHFDWDITPNDAFSIRSEGYSHRFKELALPIRLDPPALEEVPINSDVSGWHVLARWQHTFSSDTDIVLQGYYDHNVRDEASLRQRHDIFDIDFRHRLKLTPRQELIWGLDWRHIRDSFNDSTDSLFGFAFSPPRKTNKVASLFIQDEVLLSNAWILTFGSKFEDNDYTGVEVQPSARLLWMPNVQQRVWAAVSRAVRTPSRLERDGRQLDEFIPPEDESESLFRATTHGNSTFDSETLLAYELGYRLQPQTHLSLDIAVFYNRYDRLVSFEPSGEVSNGQVLEAQYFNDNKLEAKSYGVELGAAWQVADNWQIKGAYTFLRIEATRTDNSQDDASEQFYEESSPRHQASLRSLWDVRQNVSFDLWMRYTDELMASDPELRVSSYVALDARLTWKLDKALALSLVGQNLIQRRHVEYLEGSEIERGFYGRVDWRF